MIARLVSLLSVAALAFDAAAVARVTPSGLKCEYRRNPLGIDVARPRLSWTLASDDRGQQQTAYRVLVASTPELLAAGQGDLWDSGKVQSSESIGIVYAGKPLDRGTRELEGLRLGQGPDRLGLQRPGMVGNGLPHAGRLAGDMDPPRQTVAQNHADYYKDDPAPLLRKSFTLSKPVQKARAYVSGSGYYSSLNGQRSGTRCSIRAGRPTPNASYTRPTT